jgi:hypothetical protein
MVKASTGKVFQKHERWVVPLHKFRKKRSDASLMLLNHILEAVEAVSVLVLEVV